MTTYMYLFKYKRKQKSYFSFKHFFLSTFLISNIKVAAAVALRLFLNCKHPILNINFNDQTSHIKYKCQLGRSVTDQRYRFRLGIN